MNCPVDYDEIVSGSSDKIKLMIHDDKHMVSSQECVGFHAKIPPIVIFLKERQKIQGTKKIQNTDEMVGNRDTGGIAKRDTIQIPRKVRWKGLKNERKSEDTREMPVS